MEILEICRSLRSVGAMHKADNSNKNLKFVRKWANWHNLLPYSVILLRN